MPSWQVCCYNRMHCKSSFGILVKEDGFIWWASTWISAALTLLRWVMLESGKGCVWRQRGSIIIIIVFVN